MTTVTLDIPRPKPARSTLVLLVAIACCGPLAIDIYLPSLPNLAQSFNTDVGAVQLTMSIYLVGLALGQLLVGPLSDRIGRRPVLLGGLALFAVASFACSVAQNIDQLIALRFLQALGGCSGPVLSRAIARDLFDRSQVARAMATIASAMSLAPVVAPMAGGWLQEHFGWHASFEVSSGLAVVLVVCAWRWLHETNSFMDASATSPSAMLRNYGILLKHPVFLSFALANAFIMGALFCYVSDAPFVLIDVYRLSPETCGIVFALIVVFGFMAGSTLARQLAVRILLHRMVYLGLGLTCVASLALLLLVTFTGTGLGVIPLVPIFAAFLFGCAIVFPGTLSGVVDPFPQMAGAASGLMGFIQMIAGAMASFGVAHVFNGTALPMAISLIIGTWGAMLVFSYLRLRIYRRPAEV